MLLVSAGAVRALIAASITGAAPLAIAAVAGVLCERAGVVNIALEGLMLAGAFAGAWAGQTSWLLGLTAVVATGAAIGLLHAFLTQKMRMDHVVSGLGINLLAAGTTRFLALVLFPEGMRVAGLPVMPWIVAAVVLPPLVMLVLHATPFGLRLRASGEDPMATAMAGVSPIRVRFAAVTISGILAAFAGAYLSMADAHTFSSGMSAGKGYVALAAVIFGKWKPIGAAAGALFFGFFYALQTQLQIASAHLVWLGVNWTSPYLLDSVPYAMTILALVSVVGRAQPPRALGISEAGL